MRNFFDKLLKKIRNFLHSVVLRISFALYETEQLIFKSDAPDGKFGSKKHQRKRHRNNTLERFYEGQRDEKYTQDYYEILKKSDKFMKESTAHKMATTADKHGMNYGLKDKWGRRYEHYGFFDEKHKNAGKTLLEVIKSEYEERKTKDDNYELLYVFSNTPIEVGMVDLMNVFAKASDKERFNVDVDDLLKNSKKFRFPIECVRENKNTLNKIEQLTETLHVKKIGFEYVQLEFFIPNQFGTENLSEDSELFKELCNFTQVLIRDEYGKLTGFGITEFKKRVKHADAYDVWKFNGILMETVN